VIYQSTGPETDRRRPEVLKFTTSSIIDLCGSIGMGAD
jgi:hypothetical protein